MTHLYYALVSSAVKRGCGSLPSKMTPDNKPSGTHTLVHSPLLECRIDLVADQKEDGKSDRMLIVRLDYKRL